MIFAMEDGSHIILIGLWAIRVTFMFETHMNNRTLEVCEGHIFAMVQSVYLYYQVPSA